MNIFKRIKCWFEGHVVYRCKACRVWMENAHKGVVGTDFTDCETSGLCFNTCQKCGTNISKGP